MISAVRKAVFPVGGLGTRFLPATKSVPKEMFPVVDRPLIHYAIEEALAAGIEEVIIVTGRGKTEIEDFLDRDPQLEQMLKQRGKTDELDAVTEPILEPGRVLYTRQQEPLGLGHAVWCARALVGNEPFAVILPDDLVMSGTPCLKQLIDIHDMTGGNVVAVMDVPPEQTSRYGILDVEEDEGELVKVRGLVEKPQPDKAPSTLSIIGRYVLMPDVFKHLERQRTGTGGEIQLTDAMAELIGVNPFHALRFEGTRFDCGDKLGFLEANIAYALARDDLRSGVKEILSSLTPGSGRN